MDYIEHISDLTASDNIKELRAVTESLPMSNMQIDVNQAVFLKLLIQIIGARKILEIGTFHGYSTAVMAEAMYNLSHQQPSFEEEAEKNVPMIYTIEARYESAEYAQKFWHEYLPPEIVRSIQLMIGDAKQILSATTTRVGQDADIIRTIAPFDLIFIDADKTGYKTYLEQTRHLVRAGGLIVLDNMLNAGLVATSAQDKTTIALKTLTQEIFSDPAYLSDFDPYLIPAWDGVVIMRKK